MYSDEEIKKYDKVDEDFTPDISEEEAFKEVQRATRQVDIDKKRDEAFKRIKRHQNNPIKLWQEAYNWLIESNPDAKKDIDVIIEECRELRETSHNKYARGKDLNMRHGMRIPVIVITTLSLIDTRIKEMEVLDEDEASKVYRQLEKAFPQFKIPKTD